MRYGFYLTCETGRQLEFLLLIVAGSEAFSATHSLALVLALLEPNPHFLGRKHSELVRDTFHSSSSRVAA